MFSDNYKFNEFVVAKKKNTRIATAKRWNPPKRPLMDGRANEMQHTRSRILLTLKKGGNSDTCDDMAEPRKRHVK